MKHLLAKISIAWVRKVRQLWALVLVLVFASSVMSVFYVTENLGIQTNTADMISPSLEWRQRYIDYQRQFPHFEDTLAIVVDGRSAEHVTMHALALSEALAAQSDVFKWVDLPAQSPFFSRNALLFLDEAQRAALMTQLINAQALIGRLHRDPSLTSLAILFEDAVSTSDAVDTQTLDNFASEFARAIESSLTETDSNRLHMISWRQLFSTIEDDTRQLVIRAAPIIDFNQLFPAQVAMQAVRSTAKMMALDETQGLRVRITGGIAMNDEELRTVSAGAERSAIFALIGVCLVLVLGLGSLRMVLATVLTLLVGLLWTATFAAAAIGHLNMISVAFAVLYIGLGVDYAVHYSLRYRELLRQGASQSQAIDQAGGDVGVAISLCALTTGIGFFAFVPTEFAGVSELGLIAGVGMFISLFATLTLMPAFICAFNAIRVERAATPNDFDLRFARGCQSLTKFLRLDLGHRSPRAVSVAAMLVAAVSIWSASDAHFDENPLNLREASGEAVSTYRELVSTGEKWSLDVLVHDLAKARAIAEQLHELTSVADVTLIEDFIPPNQQQALLEIDDLALLLGPQLSSAVSAPSSAQLASQPLQKLQQTLSASRPMTKSLSALSVSLDKLMTRLEGLSPERQRHLLNALQHASTGYLRPELERIADALNAQTVDLQSLPQSIVKDWRAPDGRYRLQIAAANDLNDHAALVEFVEQVQGVASEAVGAPIVHLLSAQAVVLAFIQAMLTAFICIAIVLFVALRRVLDVVIVLLPLLLAMTLSVATMVWFDLAFNFANVIALPLLLGVGVDSGIHMLARARMAIKESLALSSTARGVVTSALTTTVGFGNLAFSPHPGTASMGVLLTVGMLATLLATLWVLPALVRLFDTQAPNSSSDVQLAE